MKKFSVLIALALLAVAGTGYAVTCSYDNVPARDAARSVLQGLPQRRHGCPDPDRRHRHPRVGRQRFHARRDRSRHGVEQVLQGRHRLQPSAHGQGHGVLLHARHHERQAQPEPAAVQHDEVPRRPVRPQEPGPRRTSPTRRPSAGARRSSSASRTPRRRRRLTTDVLRSISQYNLTSADAIGPVFRPTVWDSLDESGDITTYIDVRRRQHPRQGQPAVRLGLRQRRRLLGRPLRLPDDRRRQLLHELLPRSGAVLHEDAIATIGLGQPTYTPNVLIGDVFYVDSAANGGNISGDPAVAVEFDSRLNWPRRDARKTFFGKFVATDASAPVRAETDRVGRRLPRASPCYAPAPFLFGGDGREPLGDRYGFRYLADSATGLPDLDPRLALRPLRDGHAPDVEPLHVGEPDRRAATRAPRARASMTRSTRSRTSRTTTTRTSTAASASRPARRATTRPRTRSRRTSSSSRSASTCSRRPRTPTGTRLRSRAAGST